MRKSSFAIAALLPLVALAAAKYHDEQATIVSTDAKAHKVTIKGEDGVSHTAPVEGTAIESLANLKTGDKVTVTCKDDEHGEHKAVTAIKPSK